MASTAVQACRALLSVTAFAASLIPCAEAEWQPATVASRDGSEFHVLVRSDSQPRFQQADGQTIPLSWKAVSSAQLGDRWPLEQQQQAERDMADLKSDDFATRQAALKRLRKLGAAAGAALRKGSQSDDPEVATRSRELLSEMGIGEDTPDASHDRIELKDGKQLTGRLLNKRIDLHTRWGVFAFPLTRLSELRSMEKSPLSPPPAELEAVSVSASTVATVGRAEAFAMSDLLEDPAQPPSIGALHAAGFDDLQANEEKLKSGTVVEDAYADKGLLLRAVDAKQRVIVDDSAPIPGRSGGLSACANTPQGMGDIELQFIQPGSFDAKNRQGRPAGVHLFGFVANAQTEGYVGLEAYDRCGRLLVRCQNKSEPNVAAASFVGIRATVPVVRIRVFRMPGYERHPLRIDDIIFDACVPADREPTQALLELESGERLVGRPEASAAEGTFAFRPSFLPQAAPAIAMKMSQIKRYEPPVKAEDSTAPPRPPGPLHAVRLQNGEAFHARFVKLDAEKIALELPGRVQLSLPRSLVRKIDLFPKMAKAGSEPASLAKDEKPGVEFRPKRLGAGAKPRPDQEAELPRMDNAEVISADITTGELTVDPKDGAGAWRIDLFSTRFLVFPPSAEAVDGGRKREWVLRLRQGGRFAVALTAIEADHLEAEMAGAKVNFPARVVAAVERAK